MTKPVFEIYEQVGKWRWHLKSPDGKIVASSSQGYETRDECIRHIEALGIFLPIALTPATPVAEEALREKVLPRSIQIFISHSSNDEELIGLIELAFYVSPIYPYFARLQQAGQDPAHKVVQEIGKSKAVFVVLTPNVFAKTETLFWVLFEIGIAMGKDRRVYAWIDEGCSVPECLKYVTDYQRFKSNDHKDCQRVAREMLDVALKL